MIVLLIFTLLLSIDVLVCQIHYFPVTSATQCYVCDGVGNHFPNCLNSPVTCNADQTCSLMYYNSQPNIGCENRNDCHREITNHTYKCEGDGVLIASNLCKRCCDTPECLTEVVNVLLKEYNHNVFCPGRCSESDPEACIHTGTRCFQFQFCELSIDDHLIITGTCRYLHEYQKCNADRNSYPCANSLLAGGHLSRCVWDCCTTTDCVNTHFGALTAVLPHVTIPATIIDPTVRCVSCSGATCSSALQYVTCPGGFCMHSVYHLDSGALYQERTCASRDTCNVQWSLQPEVIRTRCVNAITNGFIGPLPLTCHFCCQGDLCNANDYSTHTWLNI